MTLTHEQVKRLNEPFEPNDHEFLRGYIYITEYAIVARLSDVDPSWSWQIKTQYRNGNQVVTAGTLTVCGVSRDGVGEAIAEYKADTGRQVNEAEKSSVTDALKRASRLFGIGSYLLTTPDFVKTPKDVAKWLAYTPTERPTQRPTQPRPQARSGEQQIRAMMGSAPDKGELDYEGGDFMDTPAPHRPAPNHDPDRGNVPYEGGDFMDTPARAELSFVFVELKEAKNGAPFMVYQAEKDASVKVNVFKHHRPMFDKVGLAKEDKIPSNFVGTVERDESGKFWNLTHVSSF